MHGEIRRVVGGSDVDHGLVQTNVVGPIRNRLAKPQIGKVVDLDLDRLALRTPRFSGIFEPKSEISRCVFRSNPLSASPQRASRLLTPASELPPALGASALDSDAA
jgi:hypothetical protein